MTAQATGWSDHSIVTCLQVTTDELGHPPTSDEFNGRPGPSSQAVRRAFGSWNRGLLAAGLDIHDPERATVDYPAAADTPAKRGSYRKGFITNLGGGGLEQCPHETNRGGHKSAWQMGWRDAEEWRSELESSVTDRGVDEDTEGVHP